MGHTSSEKITTKQSFWRSLAEDPTANVIVISAAAMVPLMAMVGGGIDASRYYMAEARMQAACDAGALAARRAMDDDQFNGTHKQIGRNFFDQNYEDDLFGLEGKTREYTGTSDGKVQGEASGTLPTSIMGAFGYDEFNIEVSCEADINISNTDIVFVLDVTGSMNCVAGDTACTNNGEVEAVGSKIDGLRDAAVAFYDVVDDATSDSAQVRYGIVPYSSAVNVGGSLNTAWMAPAATYQSREPTTIVTEEWVDDGDGVISSNKTGSNYNTYPYLGANATTRENLDYDECVDFAFGGPYWDEVNEYDVDDLTLINTVETATTRQSTYEGAIGWKVLWQFVSGYHTSDNRCVITFDEYSYDAWGTITLGEILEQTETFAYRFDAIEYDLTELYDTGVLTAPTGTNGANETHIWNGCIEEADTAPNTTSSFSPVPATANDLDIDLVPNAADEFWKPALNTLVHYRFDSETGNWSRDEEITENDWDNSPRDVCPLAAQRLTDMTRGELVTYLSEANGFVARGSTYHDIGMIWGARFISPDGIFASDNATAPNGDAISRHIIYMTDGVLSTNNTVYTPYGIEWWDRRITDDGNTSTSDTRHAARFQAACQAAQNKNISVWVIAFGTELTSNLESCATPGRAFQADDTAELEEQFQQIAEQIAALRLTS